MLASVWMKLSKGPAPMMRPVAEMMPAVTVLLRPKGLPMARTHSPTRALSESANVQVLGVDLYQGEVGFRVRAHHSGLVFVAVLEAYGNGVRALNHVIVGYDESVFGDDEA
jgi:hypothetical protein